MDIRLIEKFLNDACTPEEAERVLEWFDTPEGREYLEDRMDTDIERFEGSNLHLFHPELDSENLFQSIRGEIASGGDFGYRKYFRPTTRSPFLRVAAIILIGLVGSVLFFAKIYRKTDPNASNENHSKHYRIGPDKQRLLTLRDGTKIRLNSNSQIWIASDYLEDSRQVRLTGEAFFDVARNPEKPFIINTERAQIKVMGTEFNVKSDALKQTIQVAVIEGLVSVRSNRKELNQNSIVLARGQFGFLNDGDEFSVENFGVENYLSWMNGRLIFENLTLNQVCTQMTRLYEIRCRVPDDSLKNLKLTTNISSVSSLEKVLSVISLSLDISYKKSKKEIIWFNKMIDQNQVQSQSGL